MTILPWRTHCDRCGQLADCQATAVATGWSPQRTANASWSDTRLWRGFVTRWLCPACQGAEAPHA